MPTWTVNNANFVPHERHQLSCVTLPLNPGELYAPAHSRLSDRIELRGTGATGPVEGEVWTAGPRYRDGSIRRLRAYFPTYIDAGSASHGLNYPHPILRFEQYTAELFPGRAETLPAYSQHDAVDLSGTIVILQYQLGRLGSNTGTGGPIVETFPVREIRCDLTTGSIIDYRDGTPYPTTVTELDSGSKLAKRSIIAARIFPEWSGGSTREPPILLRLYVEVPAATGGPDGWSMGRAVRVDYEVSNFLITDDSPDDPTWPRRGDPSHCSYVHVQEPILRIVMPAEQTAPPGRFAVTANGVVVHQRTAFHRPLSVVGQSVLIPISDSTPSAPYQSSDLGSTICHPGMMTIFYPGGTPLTALEDETLNAIDYDDGEQAMLDLMSADWPARDRAVGPIGALETGVPYFWADSQTQREAAGAQTYYDWLYCKDSLSRFNIFPDRLYGSGADNSRGGEQPESGTVHLHWLFATGWPDLRAARIHSMMDSNRKITRRYLDGSPTRPWESRHTGAMGFESWTDIVYFNGTPYPNIAQSDCLGRRISNSAAGGSRDIPSPVGAWSTIDDQHGETGAVACHTAVLSPEPLFTHGLVLDHAAQAMVAKGTYDQLRRLGGSVIRIWSTNNGRTERICRAQANCWWAADDADYIRHLAYQMASRMEMLHQIGTTAAGGGLWPVDYDDDLNRELAQPHAEQYRQEAYLHNRWPNFNNAAPVKITLFYLCVPYYFACARALEDTDPATMPTGVTPRDVTTIAANARWMCERMSRVVPLYGFQITDLDTHGMYRWAWELSFLHGATRGAAFDVATNPSLAINGARGTLLFDNAVESWQSYQNKTRFTFVDENTEGIASGLGDISVEVSGFTGSLTPLNGTHTGRNASGLGGVSGSGTVRWRTIEIDYDSSSLGSGGNVSGPVVRLRRGTAYAVYDNWGGGPGTMPQRYGVARLSGPSILADLLNPAETAVFDRVRDIFWDETIGHIGTGRFTARQAGSTASGVEAWISEFLLHWFGGIRNDAIDRFTQVGGRTLSGQAVGDAGADGLATATGTLYAVGIGDAGADGQAIVIRLQLHDVIVKDGGADGIAVAEVIDSTISPLIVFASALGDAGADGSATGTLIGPPGLLQHGVASGDAGADGLAESSGVFTTSAAGDAGADGLGSGSLVLAPTRDSAGTRSKVGPETIRERTGSPAEQVVRNIRTSRGENRFVYQRTIYTKPGKPDRRPIKTGRP